MNDCGLEVDHAAGLVARPGRLVEDRGRDGCVPPSPLEQKATSFTPQSHVVSLISAQIPHALGLNDVADSLRLRSGFRGTLPSLTQNHAKLMKRCHHERLPELTQRREGAESQNKSQACVLAALRLCVSLGGRRPTAELSNRQGTSPFPRGLTQRCSPQVFTAGWGNYSMNQFGAVIQGLPAPGSEISGFSLLCVLA